MRQEAITANQRFSDLSIRQGAGVRLDFYSDLCYCVCVGGIFTLGWRSRHSVIKKKEKKGFFMGPKKGSLQMLILKLIM